MTELRRIFGTSVLSLLLVIWGLFMVCSGRVPDVNYDDDLFADSEFDMGSSDENDGNSDLMTQLAALDDESSSLENNQRDEILAALGIDSGGSEISRQNEQDFLNEELFLDLEVEISALERAAKTKAAVAESLRTEVQEADFQLTALNTIVGESPTQFASSTPTVRTAPVINSSGSSVQFNASYQDALNDVYARNFPEAITKFRQLLQTSSTDDLADNCQYWIGESHYALGQYEAALAEFERVFAFDNNNKADDAQFMIGMSYIKLGDPSMAKVELENLMTFYQDSEYLARAEREFGGLNM